MAPPIRCVVVGEVSRGYPISQDDPDRGAKIYEEYKERVWGGLDVAIRIRNDRARVLKDCGYTVKVGTIEFLDEDAEQTSEDRPKVAFLQATKQE